MPVTREQVEEFLAGEEPDYEAAAAAMGADAIAALTEMVADPDPTTAARAASLAGFIGSQGAPDAVAPVLAAAAAHADPVVRVNAAYAAAPLVPATGAVLLLSLADQDPGVRRIALERLPAPVDPVLVDAVAGLAAGDSDPGVMAVASDLVA